MTADEKLDVLLARLEGILRLLALQAVANMRTGEAVQTLDRAGLDRKTIAAVLGTTQSSVRGFISQNAKGPKTAPKKKEVHLASGGK
jgi:hypothetical protein